MKRKPHIPLRIRLAFWTRNWVWLFWLLLLPLVWVLLPLEHLTNPITGLVFAETETVGAIETVRIRALPVEVGQRIAPGDVLVEVEGFAEQKDKLEALDYTVRMLGVLQNAQQQEQSLFALELRTRQQIEDTQVALAEKEMEQSRDKATLEGLRKEVAHLDPMIEQGLIPDTELIRLRPQITALNETLACYPTLISTLNARLASAKAELEQIAHWKATHQSSLSDAQEKTLSAISVTVTNLEKGAVAYLRAKSAGVVSRIQYAVGDVVPTGTPILRITADSDISIIGLLRPHQAVLVSTGMTLTVVPPFRSTYKRYEAVVTRIEPEVLDLTDPFTPLSRNRFPTRGRRMTLTLKNADHDFIPGETVTIYLPPPTFKQKIDQIISQIQWKVEEKQARWGE
ncbi:MAG: HlyD family secretion protein [Kiritimatiellaeota bacterium]|nr:HlyD family secretion protein [Kiritimatiellota bacterium]